MSLSAPLRLRRCALACAALLALAIAPGPAVATDPCPGGRIRLVVSQGAGGVMDSVARLIADRLEPALGQPVVVENRPGASGNIASTAVANAAPDGCTLLVAATALAVLPSTLPDQAVDPLRALAPVTKIATQPVLLAANPALPATTLADVVALARSAPGTLAYATSGIATADHLAALVLAQRAAIDLLHVPYVNIGQEMKDLLHGEIKLAFVLTGTAQPHLATGALKAIAVTGPLRLAALPDTPTVAESGYPGFEILSWYGLLAPAGTPAPIIERLQREVAAILQQSGVGATFAAKGLQPVGNTPEQFRAELSALVAFWRPVVRAAGIAPK